MTEEQKQRIADEISQSIVDCDYCYLSKECDDSEREKCSEVWYDHIWKV